MPYYQIALFLHILGALAFFIAIAILYTSVLGVRRAQTVQQIKLWTGAAAPAIRLIFPIAGLVILIAGFYMAVTVWGERPWAGVALVAFLLLMIVSALLQGRRITMLGRQVADQPDNTPVTGALWTQAHDPVTWVGGQYCGGVRHRHRLPDDAQARRAWLGDRAAHRARGGAGVRLPDPGATRGGPRAGARVGYG